MYILKSNERKGIDNRQIGMRALRDKLYEELLEINVEVDQITIDGHDDAVHDLIQELMDLRTTVNSFIYNLQYNYMIELEPEEERHNMKLAMRDWTLAGYYECELREADKIE